MKNHQPPELDMTLDGEFVSPPTPSVSTRIMFWAIIVAVVGGAVVLAALALWLAMLVLPVVVARRTVRRPPAEPLAAPSWSIARILSPAACRTDAWPPGHATW